MKRTPVLISLILAVTSLLFAQVENADSSPDEISKLFQQLEQSVAEDEAARAESEARQILGLLLERMAALYQITGQTELRHKSLEEAVRASSLNDRALVKLVEFYLETGRYEEGIDTVQSLLAINALHVQGQYLLGKLHILAGNPLAATHPLRDAYESADKNSQIGLALAHAYLEAGDINNADRLIKEIQTVHGESVDLFVRTGRVYLETGQYGQAIESFEAAAAKSPDEPSITALLKLAKRQMEISGSDSDALGNDFGRSVLLDDPYSSMPTVQDSEASAQLSSLRQDVASVYRILGQAQMQQNLFLASVRSFAHASFWNSDLEGLELLKATALFRAGDLSRASEVVRQRLQSDSSDRQALWLLAQVAGTQAQSGDLTSARSNVEYLLSLVPDSAVLLVLRGRIAAESGELDSALSDFDAALDRDRNLPEANFNSGAIYWKKEDFDRALEYFEAELELNPAHEQAAFRKASILLNRGNDEEALRTLEELTSRGPAFAEPYILLAQIQTSRGELAQAMSNLETAAQIEPDRADIFQRLSEIYQEAGRSSDARQALEHYRRLTDGAP